jgi:ferredoxin--NADP+ reductase
VTDEHSGKPVPGLYTAGWIKRGPSGVIGTNKKCANETVEALLADLTAGLLATPTIEPEQLLETLERRGVRIVDYTGWEAIDAHERATGEPHGRPRVKLTSRDQMLQIASS